MLRTCRCRHHKPTAGRWLFFSAHQWELEPVGRHGQLESTRRFRDAQRLAQGRWDVSRSEGPQPNAAKQSRDVRVRPSLAKADLSAKSEETCQRGPSLGRLAKLGRHTIRVNYHARGKRGKTSFLSRKNLAREMRLAHLQKEHEASRQDIVDWLAILSDRNWASELVLNRQMRIEAHR